MPRVYWRTYVLVMASILMLWCGTSMADIENIYSANVTTQEIVEAFAAPFVSVVSGNAHAGDNGSVCVAHRADGLYIPLACSVMGRLYGVVSNGTLDPLHGCYLSAASADGTRSCVAHISSSPAECGGVGAESLNAAASSLDVGRRDHVLKSGAEALVASMQHPYGAEQLTLARSLLHTREVESLLSTEEALLKKSLLCLELNAEKNARQAACVSRISKLVQGSYDTVMAKYGVLKSWLGQSLGGVGDAPGDGPMLGTSLTACRLNESMEKLLHALTPEEVMGVAIRMMNTLSNSLESQPDSADKIQPVLCLQGIYAVAVLAIEDARIRSLRQKLIKGTISEANTSTHTELLSHLSTWKESILNNMGMFFEIKIDSIAEKLFGAQPKTMAECLKRAVLRVPYPSTGELPPSIFWCLNPTLTRAAAGRVVEPYASERVVTRCPPGHTLWSGSCGGKFDARRCVLCPAGSVLATDGYCACVNPDSYVKGTGGCTSKGESNAPPTFEWALDASRVVQVPSDDAGDGSVPKALFTVSLPSPATLSDESAYLSVSAVCDLGVTTLMASPVGNRSADCGADVSYERRVERTGLVFVGPGGEGSVVAETYATSLRVSVVSTGGVFGDTCTFTAVVGSTLRKASETISVGKVTLLMQAAPLKLRTSGSRLSERSTCEALASQPPQGDGIVLGVCRPEEEEGALYFDPRRYRFLPSSGLDGLLNSAAVHSNTSLLKRRLHALGGRVGLRMTVLGEDDEVLVQSEWIPSRNETVGTVWRAVRVLHVRYEVLKAMRRVRVEALDPLYGSALAPRLDTVAYRLSEDHPHAGFPWVALIASAVTLCVLIASQICLMLVLRRRLRGLEKDTAAREGRGYERAPH